jgi:FixJ family two-component response regulator
MAKGAQQVVIVEDDPGMRQALRRLLRLAGYAPLAYESAEAFMDDGGAAAATCLILDVRLPGISGFELRERLTARDGRAVPVIFVTAYDEPETRQHATRAGAVACLAKPFAGRDLIDAVMQAHGESPPPRRRPWRD